MSTLYLLSPENKYNVLIKRAKFPIGVIRCNNIGVKKTLTINLYYIYSTIQCTCKMKWSVSLLKLKLVIYVALGLFHVKIWVRRIDFFGIVFRLTFFCSLKRGLIRRIKLASTNAAGTTGFEHVICHLFFQKLQRTNYENL